MVYIKEKLKLGLSASSAQAAISGKWWDFQLLLNKKEEILAKRFKIMLAEKPNLQEAAESKYLSKLAETKIIKKGGARNKRTKSWTVPQALHGGGVEVGPPEMPGVRQPSTFSRKKLLGIFIYTC